MPKPAFTALAEVYVHAAAGSVWRRFSRLADWPLWDAGVANAAWTHGEPWQDGSIFTVHRRGGLSASEKAVVRMAAPGEAAVWESSRPGLHVVHAVRFSDELGGCKLSAQRAYHGSLAPLVGLLWRGREARRLHNSLAALAALIERSPR